MKHAFFAAAVCLLAAAPVAAADSYVAYSGATGYVAQDGRVLFTDGSWAADAEDRDGDGRVDLVRVTRSADGDVPRSFVFASGEPGRPVEPGVYTNAATGPVDGRTQLRLLLNGYDTSPCSGQGDTAGFVVLRADFDTSGPRPRVLSFAARFELVCDLATSSVQGVVAYEATDVPEIAVVDYAAADRSLAVRGPNVALDDTLVVDGVAYPARADASGALVARRARLANGPHAVAARRASDGSTTAPFAFRLGGPTGPPFRKNLLKVKSPQGDFVGAGRTYKLSKGTWLVGAADYTDDGAIDAVQFTIWPDGDVSRGWSLQISPAAAGENVAVATFPDTRGHPTVEGHVGLDVAAEGRGCQDEVGSLTITDFAVDASSGIPKLLWIGMTFEQHCNLTSPPLTGTLHYVPPPTPTVTAVRYDPERRTLRVEGERLTGGVLTLDGQQLGPLADDGGALVLSNVDLAPGLHAVFVSVGDLYEIFASKAVVFRR